MWLFPSWVRSNWWNVSDTDCGADEMRTALEHSLRFTEIDEMTSNASRVLVSGKVIIIMDACEISYVMCLQTVLQYQEDLQCYNDTVNFDVDLKVGYVYDAMWTIALALNSSISILEDRGLGRLEDFTYDSVEMADMLTEAVANVSFEGISVSTADV